MIGRMLNAFHIENHLFYIKNENGIDWVAAKNLKVGDMVMYADGTYHSITDIISELQVNTVYNLHVKDNHNYYVGENNILVHNLKAYSN